jgi:hypothetical protein
MAPRRSVAGPTSGQARSSRWAAPPTTSPVPPASGTRRASCGAGRPIEHWLNGRLALQLDFSEPGLEASLREKEGRFYVNQKLPATVARRPQIRLYECGEPIAFRRLRVAALTTNAPATSTVPR